MKNHWRDNHTQWEDFCWFMTHQRNDSGFIEPLPFPWPGTQRTAQTAHLFTFEMKWLNVSDAQLEIPGCVLLWCGGWPIWQPESTHWLCQKGKKYSEKSSWAFVALLCKFLFKSLLSNLLNVFRSHCLEPLAAAEKPQKLFRLNTCSQYLHDWKR